MIRHPRISARPARKADRTDAYASSKGSRKASARASRRARGSVMILSMALLVLMAIMGSAYLMTTRTDRVSAQVSSANIQTDMIGDGVKNLIEAEILRDLFDNANRYRPAEQDSDSASSEDPILAPRAPHMFPIENKVFGGKEGVRRFPQWMKLSQPLVTPAAFVDPTEPFDKAAYGTGSETDSRGRISTDEGFLVGTKKVGSRQLPALLRVVKDADEKVIGTKAYAAADTDGDGLADAGLWRLGLGNFNGVTYFAAVRVVDNNSAVNASTARGKAGAAAGDGTSNDPVYYADLYPTHVDLPRLLTGSGEATALDQYRFHAADWNSTPLDASGNPVAGYSYASPSQAMWGQLASQLTSPGYNFPGVRYQTLPATDTLKLGAPRASSGTPDLAMFLPHTLGSGSKTFGPIDAEAYPGQRFDYVGERWSRWPLLVTSNPVSGLAPTRPPLQSDAQAFFEQIGGFGDLSKGRNDAIRTPINTATFATLWRTFYQVMAVEGASDADSSVPLSGSATTADYNPYSLQHSRAMFRSPIRDARITKSAEPEQGGPGQANTVRLVSSQVMLLRSAIAAVNAMDIRDSDHEVTSKEVSLTVMVDGSERQVKATVYGAEPQVYITEVFASTGKTDPARSGGLNNNGYVAVELHNPYDFPIPLDGWKLATLKRTQDVSLPSGGYPVEELADLSGKVVPARGHLVLENYDASEAPSANSVAATFRPAMAGTPANTAYVKDLHQVFGDERVARDGRELVLLRPRSGSNGLLRKMIPADQFDFTGLMLKQDPPTDPTELAALSLGELARMNKFAVWHYARANGLAGNNHWRFVYPGRYDTTKGQAPQDDDLGRPRHELRESGTNRGVWYFKNADELAGVDAKAVGASLGNADDGNYRNLFPPLPINADAAASKEAPDRFPYGGFARVGDVLKVPFVGAYTIAADAGGNGVLEMNGVAMDCAFADDLDPSDDPMEHVGRFAPLQKILHGQAVRVDPGVLQNNNTGSSTTGGTTASAPSDGSGSGTTTTETTTTGSTADGSWTAKPYFDRVWKTTQNWRPHSAADHNSTFTQEQFAVGEITNADAIQIKVYPVSATQQWVFRKVHLRDFEVGRVTHDPSAYTGPKLHCDHIQFHFGGDNQPIKTTVVLEDGYLHGGNTDSIILKDGRFDLVHLKNMRIDSGLPAVKVSTENSGEIDQIFIENCPNLKMSLQGRRGVAGGKINKVIVKNSPGAKVVDEYRVGVEIIYDNAANPDTTTDDETGSDNQLPPADTNPPAPVVVDYENYTPNSTWYEWADDVLDRFSTLTNDFATVRQVLATKNKVNPEGVDADDAPVVEGLINLNTAPWPVIATLPMVLDEQGRIDREKNDALARLIVDLRGDTRFKNLFDLMARFPAADEKSFANAWGSIDPEKDITNPRQGDLTPGDGIVGDLEQRFLALSRISNLVTFRSDSFTAYVVMQGWRNVGTRQAEVVTERRTSYVVDRSRVRSADDAKAKLHWMEHAPR